MKEKERPQIRSGKPSADGPLCDIRFPARIRPQVFAIAATILHPSSSFLSIYGRSPGKFPISAKSFMNHLRAYTRSIGFLRQLTSSPKPLSALSPSLRTNPFHLTIRPNIPKRTMASAMAKRLEGKTVVVTGASAGIGRSTAKEFARTSPKNLKIIVTARRIDSLNQLAQEIKEEVGEGVKVLPVKLDVSNPEEVKGFVSGLPAEFQDIDILVNNAGLVKGVAKAPDIDPQDIDTMLSTNVTGLINMTQAVLPIFKKREDGGRGDIINIGSIAGREAYPGGSIYCATKAAVKSFTDALRKELIATRIRIIGIDPGQVETEFSVVRFYGDKQKAGSVYENCEPLTPDDIAEIIVFSAGRRENVVIADTLVFPSHQASPTAVHKRG